MTVHQGDMAWRELRVGDVTASRFGDVIANAKVSSRYELENRGGKTKNKNWCIVLEGEIVKEGFATQVAAKDEKKILDDADRRNLLSGSAESYLNDLLYERCTGFPVVTAATKAMEWGTEWEAAARDRASSVLRDKWGDDLQMPVDDMAYMPHHSEPGIGFSPDFVVGDKAGGEIKCSFNPGRHIAILRDPDRFMARHRPQVQGAMWCRNWDYYYIVSYDHRMECVGHDLWIRRVTRDDDWINSVLAPRVVRFRDVLDTEHAKLTEVQF